MTVAMLIVMVLSSSASVVVFGYILAFLLQNIYMQLPVELRSPLLRALEHGLTYLGNTDYRLDISPLHVLGNLSVVSRSLLIFLTLLPLFLCVLLAVWLSRRVTRPLRSISKAVKRVSDGDFSARAFISKRHDKSETETAQLMRDFNDMALALERLETERKVTMAAIAHELRTPITILRGRLEAIRDGVLSLGSEEMNRLVHQTEMLSRLITDLQTLSLADAGRLELHRTNLEFAQLVADTVSSFQPQMDAKNIALVCHPLPISWIRADDGRLRQVLGNILENAIRYSHPGGHIVISLEHRSDCASVKIKDSGDGIPEESMNNIFNRFFRTDKARSRVSGGSGLGLAIVKTIIELHDGQVGVVNHPEGGAEFSLTIPLERH